MSTNRNDGVSAEQLYDELESKNTSVEGPTDDPAGGSSGEITADVREELPVGARFQFDEDLVKQSLDDLLLILIALEDGGAHGKGLMEKLASHFNAHLSPGTVYPRLHDLEEEGLLEVHELVKTKRYSIADDEQVRRRVERTLQHHLAIGEVFRAALEEI